MLNISFSTLLYILFLQYGFSQSLLKGDNARITSFQTQIDSFTNVVLEKHYKPRVIDDNYSKTTFADFIKALDPTRNYFFQSDVDEFMNKYQDQVDNLLKGEEGNLTGLIFIEEITNRLNERKKNILNEVQSIIHQKHDYEIDESYEPYIPYKNWDKPYAKNFEQQKDNWRKTIKYKLVNAIASGSDEQETKDSLIELYNKINSDQNYKTIEDTLGVFLRSIGTSFDPHNNYMSLAELQALQDGLSSSFYGIGSMVSLTQSGQYVKLTKIIPGSPAEKAGLKDDDVITKIKERGREAIDISFKELNEMISLIKGPKDSTVELTVRRKAESGEVQELQISVVRDEIKNSTANYARVKIIGIINPVTKTVSRIAIIKVPSFYQDENKGDSLTKDTKEILIKLSQLPDDMKVHGLVIDLMNNGGGYLDEAISFTGLFIKSGPVVIEKYRDSRKDKISRDRDSNIYYEGPLVVMINERSASASEIFAGAIQDYERGLIVGSKHSFGKGTIQRSFKDTLYRYNFASKVTVGKFFRISGDSNQHSGIASDIQIPTYSIYPTFEKSLETSLKNDEVVDAGEYLKHNEFYPSPYQLIQLKKKSANRINRDPEFKLIEEAKERRFEKDKTKGYSLKLSEIKGQEEKNKIIAQEIETKRKSSKYHSNYVEILSFTRTTIEQLLAEEEKEKKEKSVKVPNILEHEAATIASDLSKLFDTSSREVDQAYLNHLWSSDGYIFHIEELSN
ncbi:carboxy terminal-processing peptidase [Bacteriovoracaceae bacterium]|nr:carboxy terminal-processing peptidase [Bacteriovoracaceae bacterium]